MENHKLNINSKPRTWEEHKQITMSDKEKLRSYTERFGLLFNLETELYKLESLSDIFSITVEYQHKYLPTNDPRENQLVDLITEIECAMEHAERRDKNNPHLQTGSAIDVMCKGGFKRGELASIRAMDDLAFFNSLTSTTETICKTAKCAAGETILKMLDEIGKTNKYGVSNKDILDSHNYIPMFYSCYPPNIIEVRGNKVCFYHGLEEGLMCWDCMDKRKFKKELLKARRKVNGKNN